MEHTSQEILLQEFTAFAVANNINLGTREIKHWVERTLERLHEKLLTQKETAYELNVSLDMVHHYRKQGLLSGIPKRPDAKKKHWLYRYPEVMDLKRQRQERWEQIHGTRSGGLS